MEDKPWTIDLGSFGVTAPTKEEAYQRAKEMILGDPHCWVDIINVEEE